MTVKLNPAALHLLLESETGPVGRDLRRRTVQVLERASANASGSILGIDTGDLLSDLHDEISTDAQGLVGKVVTRATHRGFSYPAFWDRNGRPWLTDALRDGFR